MTKKTEAELLDLINKTPELQSILYDIGMMPEQTDQGRAWRKMLAYSHLWDMAMEKYEPEIARLRQWIKCEALRTNTCTKNILGDICAGCNCGESK